jgi:TorA maturation chaperone TorD
MPTQSEVPLSSNTSNSAAVDDALARAVLYRFLSVGFQMPTEERIREVGGRNGFSVAAAALQRLDRHGRTGLGPVATRLTSTPPLSVDRQAATFARLFGHTTRGLVCACETEWGPDSGFHQPQQLADLAGYYLAFGVKPIAASDVRVDHIACECEFMDFLSRKEALLLSGEVRWEDEGETLAVTRQAAREFLRHHLGRFGRAFATRVVAEDRDGFYGTLGLMLLAFVDAECARAGVTAGSMDLDVRPEDIDTTPMACGTADELIQIQRRP